MRTLYMRDRTTDRQPATVVHDANHNAIYLLAGKWGIRQDTLSLYNMHGDLLAEVKQLSLGLLPKFALYVDQQRVGVVGKSLGFVREVVYIRGLNWVIVGNALTNHYRVFKGSRQIFAMEPAKNSGASYLAITIGVKSEEPLAILVACVLNHWAKRPDPKPIWDRFKFKSISQPNLGLEAPINISNKITNK